MGKYHPKSDAVMIDEANRLAAALMDQSNAVRELVEDEDFNLAILSLGEVNDLSNQLSRACASCRNRLELRRKGLGP